MSIGVLALVGLSPERVAALTAAGYAVREGKKYANRIDAVREAGDTVRAVLTNGRGGLSGDEMALLPKLEIVCAVGAGYEAVDLDTARSRGIAVANCPDTNASAVADSAMMLLMAATRHLRQADRSRARRRMAGPMACRHPDHFRQASGRSRSWEQSAARSRTAPRAASTWRSAITTGRPSPDLPIDISTVSIELATWADFLVCAAPGGAGTRHLVNADVLTALGPKGYLVNIGRGTVVDTAALIDALRSKRIAGAGLDVLEGEPSVPPILPELLQFDNVVVTPHCAGRAPEARTAATALILANLNAYFAGKPLPSPVSFKS